MRKSGDSAHQFKEIEGLVKRVIETYGTVDIVVNNPARCRPRMRHDTETPKPADVGGGLGLGEVLAWAESRLPLRDFRQLSKKALTGMIRSFLTLAVYVGEDRKPNASEH